MIKKQTSIFEERLCKYFIYAKKKKKSNVVFREDEALKY